MILRLVHSLQPAAMKECGQLSIVASHVRNDRLGHRDSLLLLLLLPESVIGVASRRGSLYMCLGSTPLMVIINMVETRMGKELAGWPSPL